MDPKVQSISVFVKFVRPIGYTQNWLLPSPLEELDQNPIFLLEIGPIPFLGLDLIDPGLVVTIYGTWLTGSFLLHPPCSHHK